jgi:mannosyl-oligosaccharide glucosidase
MVGWRVSAVVVALLVALVAVVWAHFSGYRSSSLSPKWGTYRPNLYFGIKRKAPTSPLLGLLWYVHCSI